ncbi:MAG: hypothetical protein H7Z43_08820 [Clostridia bacterium]|nr:hypothetical protein [Deltaproteobacteria bacterium]
MHAVQNGVTCGKAMLGDDGPLVDVWRRTLTRLLSAGAVDQIVRELMDCTLEATDVQLEAIVKLIGYYRTNQSRMDYPRYRAMGWPIGSGIVESAHRHVLQRRMKLSRQHWSRHHGRRMVSRCTSDSVAQGEDTLQGATTTRAHSPLLACSSALVECNGYATIAWAVRGLEGMLRRTMRCAGWTTIVTVSLLLAVPEARADGRPAVLQAQALLAEQAGDNAKALELLREANKASPSDADVAFDRARIALHHPELSTPEDLDAYLSVDASSADEHLLRAYVLTARDRIDEARDEARLALAADPRSDEAGSLVEALGEPRAIEAEKAWAVRAKVFGQYDTNVSVLPDQSTAPGASTGSSAIVDSSALQRKAAGIGAEANVRWTPVRGVTDFSVAGGTSFLGHITGRTDDSVDVPDGQGGTTSSTKEGSKQYDYGTIELSTRLRFAGERWLTTVELSGTMIFIDDFNQRFLT